MDAGPALSRYRVEDGLHCVDIHIASAAQLFDNRDPAPFRERDLDPAMVEYLLNASEDLAPHGRFRIVLWCPEPIDAADLEHAFRAHFEDELARVARRRRRQRHTSQVTLVVAITLLVVLQLLAQLVGRLPGGSLRDAFKEGLVIFGWVVLWRPVDVLIFEWLPVRRQRKLVQRLLDAPLDIRRPGV